MNRFLLLLIFLIISCNFSPKENITKPSLQDICRDGTNTLWFLKLKSVLMYHAKGNRQFADQCHQAIQEHEQTFQAVKKSLEDCQNISKEMLAQRFELTLEELPEAHQRMYDKWHAELEMIDPEKSHLLLQQWLESNPMQGDFLPSCQSVAAIIKKTLDNIR